VCALIVFYEQILLVEGLLLAIHAGILVCLVALQESSRRRDLWAAAAGFLSGLACLGRGNFLMVVPVLAVACAVAPAIARRGNLPQSPTGSKPWAEIQNPRSKITNLAPVAVYLLAFVLPLSLTLWRNHYVSGQWVLITNNGPVLLYLGNASDSLGTSHYPASYFKVIKRYGSQYATPWLKELAEDVRAHPAEFIRLMLRKAWLFWNSYDIADNASYYAGKQFSWVLQWNPVAWLTVVPLAALGVWETRRQWRRQTILYAYATAFAISIILVSITGRYRLGALIPMLVWAGAGLAAIARELGARQWKGAGIRCGAAAVGIALLWPVWSPEVWRNVPEGQKGWRLVRGMDYANLALAYMDTNQRPRARKLLESIFDAYSLDFHVATQLAHLYIEDKQPNKGVSVLEPVLKTVGGDYYALIILAHAYYHAGQKTKAMMVVQQVLRENPNYEPALKTFEVLKAEGVAPEIMP
ncbi:MAG: hypothetical protein N3D11_16615, partial [Candidatus Sumerlaeia bacterium]|nr:hypothetical protein [Candidatus Sumerlaeia bacterium]